MAEGVQSAQKHQIAINVDAAGATVYMTSRAIDQLIERLKILRAAEPRECFEVHLGMEFSFFDSDEHYRPPRVTYGDGLGPVISAINNEDLPDDATASPFEVTLMHVSQSAVDEESARADS